MCRPFFVISYGKNEGEREGEFKKEKKIKVVKMKKKKRDKRGKSLRSIHYDRRSRGAEVLLRSLEAIYSGARFYFLLYSTKKKNKKKEEEEKNDSTILIYI